MRRLNQLTLSRTNLPVLPSSMRRQLCALTLAAVLPSAANQAIAQTRGGLYDPEPPADSAYLRIVIVGSDTALDLYVDDKPRTTKQVSGEVSDYLVVTAGKRTIAIHQAGKTSPLTTFAMDVPKGKALTLAFNGTKNGTVPTVFEDKANTNKLKSVVAAYNLDSKSGSLDILTADGSTKVFSNLAYGSSNSIQVNPITVELIATKQGSTSSLLASKPASLSMTQGATYSVFLLPDQNGKLTTHTVQNKTERYAGKS